jgi:hypothetical protein
MQITRGLAAVAVAVTAVASTCAAAQEWPSRLVRIVVPAAPGGSSDAAARLVTNHFQTVFRQPFIIENNFIQCAREVAKSQRQAKKGPAPEAEPANARPRRPSASRGPRPA